MGFAPSYSTFIFFYYIDVLFLKARICILSYLHNSEECHGTSYLLKYEKILTACNILVTYSQGMRTDVPIKQVDLTIAEISSLEAWYEKQKEDI